MAAGPLQQFRRDRAAAQHEGAQRGRFGQARVAQAAQLGGHHRGQRYALQRRGIHAFGQDGGGAGPGAAHQDGQPPDVEQRQRAQPAVLGAVAEHGLGGGGRGALVRHGQLHGLGLAGGARREQHRVHGVRVQQQARLQIGLEAVLERPVEHELRARQLDLAAPGLGRQPGVQGHQRGAEPRQGVQQRGELRARGQRGGHAVALPHALRRQPPRGQGGGGVQLRIGHAAGSRLHGGMVGPGARREV